MIVGRRPAGIIATASKTAVFNIAEQLAYIEHRSGEYDEREKQILNDPWVFGYDCAREGLSLKSALSTVKGSKKRSIAGKAQLLALCEAGYREVA